MTTWAYNYTPLILCIYFHGAHTNLAKIIEREQDGTITNRHN